jgi:TolB protein
MKWIRVSVVLALTASWLIACGSSSKTIPPTQNLSSNFVFVRVDSSSSLAQHPLHAGSAYLISHAGWQARPMPAAMAGGESVVMMKNDGTSETVLVSQIGPVGSVQLSLDGKKGVSMEEDNNGYMQIYYVDMTNLQSLHPVQLTTSAEDHVMPQFAPDDSRVLYHKWVSGSLAQAFTVSASGGEEIQISTPDTSVLFPAYTPDGKRIVFVTVDANYSKLFISIMNADGTGITPITGAGTNLDENPAVSPDGKTIVFNRYTLSSQGETSDIYTVGIDGSNLRQLTTDGESFDPLYVNDKIVFVSDRAHNGAAEIYSMNLDGSNQKNLTNDGLEEFFFWD